ncbi:fumarylacetoacetate hydrolase family protein [Starkeya sp. 3C]|uniref:Fumarylacetoacetate hydrolase family protein n=1 Tax=Ancylobacter moscoviensis TaxID=2597768 RepID=A0ABY3DUH0_9HYPH|nr:fumarylacetoacetate hydrolase family protein [Ancylobacter moscoviensis]TSJ63969.1 fumarylacetoacetate hydrolase family protein [Ancylobacter moscoviensis]
MKLASFRHRGHEKVGAVQGDIVVDLAAAYEAMLAGEGLSGSAEIARAVIPADMVRFIELGEISIAAARRALAWALDADGAGVFCMAADDVEWLPAVARPRNVFCTVVNNPELVAHAIRAPDYPIYYAKPNSSLIGHLQPIEIREKVLVHPESEFAFVVGKTAKNVAAEDAYDYVFGYTILNDVTSPEIRRRDLLISRVPAGKNEFGEDTFDDVTFTVIARHKGMDTFGPLGPWIVTKDEIADPHDLHVRAWLGERLINEDHTGRLRFTIPEVMAHITKWSTLSPGDIVTLGTASSTDQWPMLDADMRRFAGPIRIEVEKIGILENPVIKTYDGAADEIWES